MQVDLYTTYKEALERKLREHSVVVIDVLRATTTMTEAIASGATNVLPVNDIEEAIALYRARGEANSVLAGEREGKKIDGFDLGNSPQEFTAAAVQGKTVILTTSNGTQALNHVKNSDSIFIGCLRNRMAMCQKLLEEGKDVSLVCAGTDEKFSADDFYCAGGIIAGLIDAGESVGLDDLGQVALLYYRSAKEDRSLLQSAKHYQKLLNMDLTLDLSFCFEEDACGFVPKMCNNIVEL